MPFAVGATIEEGLWIPQTATWLVPPPDGTSGASGDSAGSGAGGGGGDTSKAEINYQLEQLVGKIGAIVAPYDPEGTNRLIQEF